MQSRRTHKKSRSGCNTCKRRRVKCDEQKPCCGQCQFRKVTCQYTEEQKPRATPPPGSQGLIPERVESAATAATRPDSSRHLLELELLHQWSTSTYKSYCGTVVAEFHNWQVAVPRLAFKHEYLLQGLLAMSALEIAAFTEDDVASRKRYAQTAIEYYILASSNFRAELTDLTPGNHQPLLALSSILMILELALPRFAEEDGEQLNMLDHILSFFELAKGFIAVVWTDPSAVRSDPLLNRYKTWDELPAQILEPDVQHALGSLSALNEEQPGGDKYDGSVNTTPEIATRRAACRQSLFFLREAFSKCQEDDYRGYALAWPFLSGSEYIAAVKGKDTAALLILMYWAMLVDGVSHGIWWAQSVGNKLVNDLSHAINHDLADERTAAVVAWARLRVGLPGLDE